MLGRASSFADLIKVGEWTAIVEVELYQPEEQNVVICRQWGGTKQARATGLSMGRSPG